MQQVFDRKLLRQRRDRAASRISDFDFLLQDVADRLIDRMAVIRKNFPLVLDLGGAHGILSEKLRTRAGTESVFTSDLSFELAKKAQGFVADEEFLPFAPHSLDAVVSNLSLHWVNDLPGALLQIKNSLKPDGLFMAAVLGGETLRELRECLMEAELDATGGVSPRVSPFIDLRDMGALMQRAGFALPVVDSDIITVHYRNPMTLMDDLRGMGASNATYNRLKKPTRKNVFLDAGVKYMSKFTEKVGDVMPATFQVIYAIGWAPHAGQQKPLSPGSAKARLAEALGTEEKSSGEKVGS